MYKKGGGRDVTDAPISRPASCAILSYVGLPRTAQFFNRMHGAEGEQQFTDVDVTNAITAVCVLALTITRHGHSTALKHTVNLVIIAGLAISRGT